MNVIASSVINGLLAVKPLAKFAKNRARTMMMDRAETIGVYWRDEVKALRARDSGLEMDPKWEAELAAIANPSITYPAYYTTSFHAYEEGNLGWLPAMEGGVAARAVHAKIWPEGDQRAGAKGDAGLRQGYHQVLKEVLAERGAFSAPAGSPETGWPQDIVDLGSSVGLSTFALQKAFPAARLTGVDLSPYFVAVAQHAETQQATTQQAKKGAKPIRWVHAAAEDTGLPAASADLVSACLVFHELPESAARAIVAEAYRLVRPGGYFSIMDMNPQNETFTAMPPYVLTLLKSTEPYLDQYLALDMAEVFTSAGFMAPRIEVSSPRHHAIIGQKPMV